MRKTGFLVTLVVAALVVGLQGCGSSGGDDGTIDPGLFTDTGGTDLGDPDTGDPDTGSTDIGSTDPGGQDTGGDDPGSNDTGGSDTGGTDTGGDVCTPDCAGKTCGDDGCGASCGSCGVGGECVQGQCAGPKNCREAFLCTTVDCQPTDSACLLACLKTMEGQELANLESLTDCQKNCPGLPSAPACVLDTCYDEYHGCLIVDSGDGECPQIIPCLENCGLDDIHCSLDCYKSATKDVAKTLLLMEACLVEACGADPSETCPQQAFGPGGACEAEAQGCLVCTPDCTGKVCGLDGCGGSCGDCGPDLQCSPEGQCVTQSLCAHVDVPDGTCTNDVDPCVCLGCKIDGMCTSEDDCVCDECTADNFCGFGAVCKDDGVCSPYNESCACTDCLEHPECL